jgi:hypothetical protein
VTTIAWISTTGGDWSNSANWQGGVLPGASDDAILTLGNAETITISSVLQVHSVTFNDPAATYDATASGVLTAAGDLVFQGTNANIDGTLIANGGSISLTMSGTIDATSGTLRADNVILRPGGTFIGPILCFASGTNIATPRGEVPVEDLRVGDLVRTDSGQMQPIEWIGQRRLDCRHHPAPDRVQPIRIASHAFGEGRPKRALLLSPDHSVFVEDVLIPIKFLVNGATIMQIDVAMVTYYHLELASHDVVIAEGLPTETYLETGGRSAFENGGGATQIHPDFSADEAYVAMTWQQSGYAPLIGADGQFDRVCARLAAQALMLGYQADGTTIHRTKRRTRR